ncbi:MAG: site-2 protease family protein [Puniceicoccales bacterium]|jgi:RIP metalloprotease RseP|nr:site-2 protease family protein [Puniceicoccales bacterium]
MAVACGPLEKAVLGNFISIILVIVFCGLSILIHEIGHYVAAKKRGLLVPKFSIGFGPKLFGFKSKGTEFVISLLPFGGYVAIPQLANLETIEGRFDLPVGLKQATCADKVLSAFAGPAANILLAIAIATAVYFIGLPVSEEMMSTTVGYVPKTLRLPTGNVTAPAYAAGILPNDRILSIDGKAVAKFDDIVQFIALGTRKDDRNNPIAAVEVERGGTRLKLSISPVLKPPAGGKYDSIRTIGIYPKQTLIVAGVIGQSTRSCADIRKGDAIVFANGEPVLSVLTLLDAEKTCRPVTLGIERDGVRKTIEVPNAPVAAEKPFLSLTFAKKRAILDLIPDDEPSKFDNFNGKFKSFQIFCSDENLLRMNGLSNGDRITHVGGNRVESLDEIRGIIGSHSEITLTAATQFGDRTLPLDAISGVELRETRYEGCLGMQFEDRMTISYPSPLSQIVDSATVVFRTLHSLFSRTSDISAKHLMGPVGIVGTLYTLAKENFPWLLWFVMLINVNLAIINLLPFPVVDGGIIVISLLERVTNWKCIEKIFSKIQSIFCILLIALIAYVTFFDIMRIRWNSRQQFEKQRWARLAINHD